MRCRPTGAPARKQNRGFATKGGQDGTHITSDEGWTGVRDGQRLDMKKALAFGLVCLFCLCLTWYATQRPSYNWDMIGYVASAVSFETSDPSEIQSRVYGLLKESVSPEGYEELTERYRRRTRSTDPESLRQYLPFYQIRVLYNAVIYALFKFGVNPFFATHFISALAASLAVLFLAFLVRGPTDHLYHLFLPLICVAYGLHELARHSTPDALSLLLVIVCYWLLLRRSPVICLTVPLLVLARTDLAILAVLFLIYLYASKAVDRRLVHLSAGGAAAAYVMVSWIVGQYGWETVFYHTLVRTLAYPETEAVDVNLGLYISVFRQGVVGAIAEKMFMTFAMISSFCLVFIWRGRKVFPRPDRSLCDIGFIVISSGAYILVHFLLFPVMWHRFFAAQYLLVACVFLYLLLEYLEAARGAPAEDGIPHDRQQNFPL